jgi:signal transduction histidine kinase
MAVPAVLRRPTRLDAGIAAGFTLLAQLEAWLGPTDLARPVHAALSLVTTGALAYRQVLPIAVLAITMAGNVVLNQGGQLSIFGTVLLAAFTAGNLVTGRRAWLALVVGVSPLAVLGVSEARPSDAVAALVFVGGPFALGRLLRDRTRRALESERRAADAEAERDEQARLAAVAERARIAREMHDVVSHAISAMAIQTQAVRRRLRPDQEREADDLRALEVTARQAMAEMRRLFGALRADDEPALLLPRPGLAQLDELVAESRATGVPVALAVEGERRPLAPGVDLAAYRIVQEALTNARKHARGASRVDLRIGFDDRRVVIEVADDGAANGNGAPQGHGLIGMRERVSLYGGTLHTGRRPEGGFEVRATLPAGDDA